MGYNAQYRNNVGSFWKKSISCAEVTFGSSHKIICKMLEKVMEYHFDTSYNIEVVGSNVVCHWAIVPGNVTEFVQVSVFYYAQS